MTDSQFGGIVKRELRSGINYGHAEVVRYIAENNWESATSVDGIIRLFKEFIVEHASSFPLDSVKFDIWAAERFDIYYKELCHAIAEAISCAKQERSTRVVEFLESTKAPFYRYG